MTSDQTIADKKYPGLGVGVVVKKGGDILMLRRKYVHGAGTWSTPGGHLEWGEDPVVCGAREVLEETGVSVGGLRFLGATNDVFPQKHFVTLWFEGEYQSGNAVVADTGEMDAVGWFPVNALPTPLFLPLENLLAGKILR